LSSLLSSPLTQQVLAKSNQEMLRELALQVVHAPILAYPLAAAVVGAVIVFIYRDRGPRVIACILCYLLFLSTMKLTVKWVFVHSKFDYPKLVSASHFLSGAIASLCILAHRSVTAGRPMPIPTAREFSFMIVPVSLAVGVSIGANNTALLHSSAAFTEVIGSTNCLITIVVVLFMGMSFNLRLVPPALLVAFGCAMSTVGEINFSMLGMVLCFVSNAFRSVKVSLQQKLMTGESEAKYDPISLLWWISWPSCVMMVVASLCTEGLAPYRQMRGLSPAALNSLGLAVGASCVNATALNLAQLFVNKDLGAVGSQLVAQSKSVLTVLGGMVIFGESVTRLECIGFSMVLFGVYVYSRMEQQCKAPPPKSNAGSLLSGATGNYGSTKQSSA